MKVEVYRCVGGPHRHTWSIRHNGRVVDHRDEVFLKDCKFVVQEGGRQRVIETRRKNVHAFVKGELCSEEEFLLEDAILDLSPMQVGYNPYLMDTFSLRDSGRPIHQGDFVRLAPNGECHVIV